MRGPIQSHHLDRYTRHEVAARIGPPQTGLRLRGGKRSGPVQQDNRLQAPKELTHHNPRQIQMPPHRQHPQHKTSPRPQTHRHSTLHLHLQPQNHHRRPRQCCSCIHIRVQHFWNLRQQYVPHPAPVTAPIMIANNGVIPYSSAFPTPATANNASPAASSVIIKCVGTL